ncbi:RDD family protein [Nocardia thailandica]|uniref:RDD family protein n=1 Tax=Nocardia thailandica TaxID=257275 RepID=A0ABW6PIF9_9NOCA|nr:RDD family protein [Nocardia thailandica]
MARITGSWLSGASETPGGEETPGYPGELYGLPRSGPGSLAGMGRRCVAMLIDWLIGVGLSMIVVQGIYSPTLTLLFWFLIGVAAVPLFGFTPGQYFMKLKVVRVDAPVAVDVVRALARQVLLVFVVPALFTDADGRGMHDRATGTALVYSR